MTLDYINSAGNNTNSIWKNLGAGFKSFINGILPWSNFIDTGIGLISGISNNIYDRQLQERLFSRDDTQLDRTMKMYERNGINPLMALPSASAGNTKGFEPTTLSSNFNQSYLNSMQKKQLNLSEEKMWLDNAIAKEDLGIKRNQAKVSNLKTELEAKALKAKLNGYKAFAHDWYPSLYPNYDLEYLDEGIDPADGSSLVSSLMRILTQVVDSTKDIKLPNLFEIIKEKLEKNKKSKSGQQLPVTTPAPMQGTTRKHNNNSHSSGTIPRSSSSEGKRKGHF